MRGVFFGLGRIYSIARTRYATVGVFIGAVLLVLLATRSVHADAVNGEVFTVRQPDGTTVEVRLWGDELYHHVESMDGYTVMRAPDTGLIAYARLSSDGNELVSTGVPAQALKPPHLDLAPHMRINRASVVEKVAAARARLEEQKPLVLASVRNKSASLAPPNNGNVQGITLLVDFSDQPGTIAPSEINNYCNLPGYSGYGNNGSVYDYFFDVSDGNLSYTNFVPGSYYRASQPKSWYDDSSVPCCNRARTMVVEALNDLDAQGFDFSQYDSDGDGLIDAVNIFYAGTRNGPWSYGLWPHSGWLSWSADGVSTGRYQITDIGNQLRLRTFCHENGHMICYWPDLYDYGYESAGVGNFCLMCYGASNTNPAEPCAYMKYDAGWGVPTILAGSQSGLPAPSGVNTFYKFEHPTAFNEYFLIENRQKTGRDAALPDQGLAIWHIDEFGDNDWEDMTEQFHYLVTLVQADGDWDLELFNNYGDSTDLWAAPTYAECTPQTDPNTNWWDGSDSGLFIREISTVAPTMTFDFGTVGDCNDNGVPDDQDILGGTSTDADGDGIPDECECGDAVSAPELNPDAFSMNRYLALAPGNAGVLTALRVTLLDLPDSFAGFEGDTMWVGPPSAVTESSGSADPGPEPTFTAARLQCAPHYMDWGTVGTVYVTGQAVMPGGRYDVQAIHQSCDTIGEPNYSAIRSVLTAPRWGDAVGDCGVTPCTGPDDNVDFIDIAAIVAKFKNEPDAPVKVRADIADDPPDMVVDFVDISRGVDAFTGVAYPFEGPPGCP
ncbi:MAG: M6 family metalloprotease domain-containing protein [Phycisphaerae bacterium]|jgi:M6 family metalloprotease-like protein